MFSLPGSEVAPAELDKVAPVIPGKLIRTRSYAIVVYRKTEGQKAAQALCSLGFRCIGFTTRQDFLAESLRNLVSGGISPSIRSFCIGRRHLPLTTRHFEAYVAAWSLFVDLVKTLFEAARYAAMLTIVHRSIPEQLMETSKRNHRLKWLEVVRKLLSRCRQPWICVEASALWDSDPTASPTWRCLAEPQGTLGSYRR